MNQTCPLFKLIYQSMSFHQHFEEKCSSNNSLKRLNSGNQESLSLQPHHYHISIFNKDLILLLLLHLHHLVIIITIKQLLLIWYLMNKTPLKIKKSPWLKGWKSWQENLAEWNKKRLIILFLPKIRLLLMWIS